MRLPARFLLPITIVTTLLSAGQAGAQQRDTARARTPVQPQRTFQSQSSVTPNRDVILEVPELAVDSIGLTVANVRAHVALDANAMNLVQITAGVDVGIQQVQLGSSASSRRHTCMSISTTSRASSTGSSRHWTGIRRSSPGC